jgi:hypothetical protein
MFGVVFDFDALRRSHVAEFIAKKFSQVADRDNTAARCLLHIHSSQVMNTLLLNQIFRNL